MSASPAWIKPFLEVLESRTSVKILGALFVISLTALCLPRSWKDRVYMTPWVSWLWPWLVVTCAFCGLMLLFTAIDVLLIVPVQANSAARRTTEAVEMELRKQLESLGEDDKELLYNPILSHRMAVQIGVMHYHVAKSLEKRGILTELQQNGLHAGSFAIGPAAFDYLTHHPELVGIKKGS
jgi:hypothetical protein